MKQESQKNIPILLSTAYLPSLEYLQYVLHADMVFIEAHEYFVKQTYRNRFDMITANGKLTLSIPLLKKGNKELITEKCISYAENWQQQHWRSITSAYKNSPYFEYFEDEFRPFYETKFEYLFEFNLKLLQTILNILRVKKEIQFTTLFEIDPKEKMDLRGISNSSHQPNNTALYYHQLFENKLGFIPNVSCLDALFNIGLQTLEIIKN